MSSHVIFTQQGRLPCIQGLLFVFDFENSSPLLFDLFQSGIIPNKKMLQQNAPFIRHLF
jgi:hypothetical protein